jgi:RNA polymerase sigma-70 factor (family 1)
VTNRYQTYSDLDLIALLNRDDEAAFQVLYERYWYLMYTIAYRKLHRKDVAEELAQELFLNIWRKRGELKIINVKAFLSVSLKNLVFNYIRHHIQEEHYLETLQQFFPIGIMATAEAVYFSELNEALQKALAQLPDKTREIFVLNRFEHLTMREIALRLNLSEKAIEYHLARSTTFLRQHLRDFSPAWVAFFLSF